MEIEKIVIDILTDLSGKQKIELSDSIREDLVLDSLGMVNLLLKFEERFNIELDESDMNPFELDTVEKAVLLAKKYVGNNYEKIC